MGDADIRLLPTQMCVLHPSHATKCAVPILNSRVSWPCLHFTSQKHSSISKLPTCALDDCFLSITHHDSGLPPTGGSPTLVNRPGIIVSTAEGLAAVPCERCNAMH